MQVMSTPRMSARVLVPAAVGVATLIGFGAGSLLNSGGAGAQTDTPTTTKADSPDIAKCGDRTPLDQATAAKVKAAALKAVPGATVDKMGHDRDDGYVAALTKADGTTHVLAREDKDFNVTSVEDPAPAKFGRDHGPGDHGPGDRAPLDGATADKVKAAALAALSGATVDKVGHDRGDGYVALLTKSDGTTRVLVHEDKDFKVTDVQDPAPERGPGGPGGRGFGDGGPKGTTPTTAASA